MKVLTLKSKNMDFLTKNGKLLKQEGLRQVSYKGKGV